MWSRKHFGDYEDEVFKSCGRRQSFWQTDIGRQCAADDGLV